MSDDFRFVNYEGLTVKFVYCDELGTGQLGQQLHIVLARQGQRYAFALESRAEAEVFLAALQRGILRVWPNGKQN